MISQGLLLSAAIHAFLGLLALLLGVWIAAEVRKREIDVDLVYKLSIALAVIVWLSWITGGWWYVLYYPEDKAIIKAGPMAYAHGFGMETKEHIFYTGLLIATMLPVIVSSLKEKIASGNAKLVFHLALAIIIGGIVLEGLGGLISIGAKAGWMAKAAVGG